jgi:hypothetical protein
VIIKKRCLCEKTYIRFYCYFFSFILLVGCGVKNNYDQETVTEVRETARSYIENNFKDVETIELQEPRKSQMGSLKIDGTVNGSADFTVSFNSDFTVASISLGEGFPDRFEECKEKSCDY